MNHDKANERTSENDQVPIMNSTKFELLRIIVVATRQV